MEKQHKRVLLLLNFYDPRLHRGIVDYARMHPWDLETAYPRFLKESARNWRGDAIITDMEYNLLQLKKIGVKIAVPTEALAEHADCIVCPDEVRIGVIAAEYFIHKGFSHFASCSGTLRGRAFQTRLKQSGYSAIPIVETYPYITRKKMKNSTARLVDLPRPCAIFCENDKEAGHVVNLALEAGLRVPEDLSVLGVGNDDLLCNSTAVSLSSVETRLYERGFRLAEALDRILDGRENKIIQRLEPTQKVIERKSTGLYAIEQPQLREMIQWLTVHAATPVQIADLAAQFHLSVSAVYRTFMNHLGISPKKLLLDARMDIARRLLLDTDDKISSIAEEAGFPTAASFFAAFHKVHSSTPQVWRKLNR